MQHIETVTVGSGGAASITFSAIPDTFTDLLIVASLRSSESGTDDEVYIKLNGVGTGQSYRRLYAVPSVGSSSGTNFSQQIQGNTTTANTFSSLQFYFANYASSLAKSWSSDGVAPNNSSTFFHNLFASSWSGTDPITEITLESSALGDFMQYSSASLYGITAGSDGIVAVS